MLRGKRLPTPPHTWRLSLSVFSPPTKLKQIRLRSSGSQLASFIVWSWRVFEKQCEQHGPALRAALIRFPHRVCCSCRNHMFSTLDVLVVNFFDIWLVGKLLFCIIAVLVVHHFDILYKNFLVGDYFFIGMCYNIALLSHSLHCTGVKAFLFIALYYIVVT